MGQPSFSFTADIESLFDELPVGAAPPALREALQAVRALLADRDREVEDFVTFLLAGQQKNTQVVVYATGGAVVPFDRAMPRVPTVVVSMADGPAGIIPHTVDGQTTTSSFKVFLADAAGAEVPAGGNYRVAYIAAS